MSLYYRTLYAWKCKGTHHKLAMDAIRLLEGQQPQKWRNLFLKHVESYLTGSKDPDKKFKDFRNHVLHVGDNYWGGAIKATQKWYDEALKAFSDRRWKEGVYATGVMSHYLTDICCPLHTAQSDKENVIHRACEWSVSCSYDDLVDALEEDLDGYPELTLSSGENWLEELLRSQAENAFQRYDKIVQGYRFELGAKDPPSGLDDEIFKEFALLIGQAGSALSLVIARCLEESGQDPPRVSLSMQTMLANLTIPVFWVTQKMANAEERAVVKKIYDELQRTGNVVDSLPEENRVITELVAKEFDRPSENLRSTPVENSDIEIDQKTSLEDSEEDEESLSPAEEYEQAFDEEVHAEEKPKSDSSRFYLQKEDPIVDAPSIGPKTASRFRKIEINRVEDFLKGAPDELASSLNTRWITSELVTAWQHQSRLMCAVPGLRGHDSQILTGVGIESREDLAEMNAEDLLPLVTEYIDSPEGKRVLRSSARPDHEEVSQWISNAQQGAQSRAA